MSLHIELLVLRNPAACASAGPGFSGRSSCHTALRSRVRLISIIISSLKNTTLQQLPHAGKTHKKTKPPFPPNFKRLYMHSHEDIPRQSLSHTKKKSSKFPSEKKSQVWVGERERREHSRNCPTLQTSHPPPREDTGGDENKKSRPAPSREHPKRKTKKKKRKQPSS